jgi:spermidine/putrescine transport system substrate-binding protein
VTPGRRRAPYTYPPLSRRRLLRLGVGSIGGLSLGALLSAYADDAPSGVPFEGSPAGVVNVANRPALIDRVQDGNGEYHEPSLERFRQETQIAVNYRPVIEDQAAFVASIEPYLAAREPTGWDVLVLTNGPTLTRILELDYLAELPDDRRPNFDRFAAPAVRDPGFDPGNRFTMAWQADVAGIAFDPRQTKRAITSVRDLFGREFAGNAGLIGDLADLPNVALVAAGVPPETSTPDDWSSAASIVAQKIADRSARTSTRAGAIEALARGDLALTMARASDVFPLNPLGLADGIQFAFPEEGGLLWIDNMVVPRGAQHEVDAITLMDFVYGPPIAAMISAEIARLAPVPSAREEVLRLSTEAPPDRAERLRAIAESPLVFPAPEVLAACHGARIIASGEESDEWQRIWSRFVES